MSQKFVAEMPITHGLIIDQPWIDYTLQDGKTWELRSTACSRTDPLALISKVSKTIVGFARLTGAKGPFSRSDLIRHFDDHCVPTECILQADCQWFYAWTLTHVVALDVPIPYTHKMGAVIWGELDDNAKRLTQPHLDDYSSVISVPDVHQSTAEIGHDVDGLLKPIARDGTIFCSEHCRRNGAYTVGSKGVEQRSPTSPLHWIILVKCLQRVGAGLTKKPLGYCVCCCVDRLKTL